MNGLKVRKGRIAMGLLAAVLLGLLGAWSAVGYASTKGIETPAYKVIEKANEYEIREYAPYIRAEVTVEGQYNEAINKGFRRVADYIFGNNTSRAGIAMTAPVLTEKASEKIAMTAPVLTEPAGAQDRYVVAFVMPAEYTLETLPTPNNQEVTLRQVPATRFAVLSFGGYATDKRCKKKIEQLTAALARDGKATQGEPSIAQFDPPWTPPFMRENEIQIALK